MRYHQWHSWYLCWTSVFDNILSYHRVQQPKSLVGRTNPSPSMAWFFLNPHNSIGFIYIIWFNNPLVNNPFKKRHGIKQKPITFHDFAVPSQSPWAPRQNFALAFLTKQSLVAQASEVANVRGIEGLFVKAVELLLFLIGPTHLTAPPLTENVSYKISTRRAWSLGKCLSGSSTSVEKHVVFDNTYILKLYWPRLPPFKPPLNHDSFIY